jgi:hypothetical protein
MGSSQFAKKAAALIALARVRSLGRARRLLPATSHRARAWIAAIAASLLVPVALAAAAPATPAMASTPAPLVITTTSPLTATAGSAFLAKLDAAGGTKPYTWSLAGGTSLPAGLVLHASTGEISGKPVGPAGTFDFTAEVTDSESPPASATAPESITVTVNPLTVTTVSLPAATAGAPYSATLAATGGVAPYSWSIPVGSLPAGLTLHAATGVISGTPKAGGTFTFDAEVTDSEAQPQVTDAPESITVGVAGLVVTTGSTLPNATSGVPYSVKLSAAGGITPYKWSLASGSLPAGLTLKSGGTLSGTTTATGLDSFTVQVTDSEAPAVTATENVSLSVVTVVAAAATHFAVAGLPGTAAAGAANSVTVTALDSSNNVVAGYAGTVHFSSTDGSAVLPADYTFMASDAGTHTFNAGVTFKTAGPQSVTATDTTANPAVTGSQSVTVNPGPLASLVVSPGSATVEALPTVQPFSPNMDVYDTQPSLLPPSADFTAEGFDAFGNDLGNLTASAQWSVVSGGCASAPPAVSCSLSVLGPDTVTATINSVTGAGTLTGAYSSPDYRCRGDNYDVNGNPADGCEVPQPLAAHTQGTAAPVGSVSCNDSPTTTITGVLPSDRRQHVNPSVIGFDPISGSAPEWYSVDATGGLFCQNDFSATLTVTNSTIPACYQLTIITNRLMQSQPTDGIGTATMSGGPGSYDDNTTVWFEVQKICPAFQADNPNFNITFHL